MFSSQKKKKKSAFHYLLFHDENKNILYISERATYNYNSLGNFQSFFASFSPDIQPNITFFTEVTATRSNSVKNL